MTSWWWNIFIGKEKTLVSATLYWLSIFIFFAQLKPDLSFCPDKGTLYVHRTLHDMSAPYHFPPIDATFEGTYVTQVFKLTPKLQGKQTNKSKKTNYTIDLVVWTMLFDTNKTLRVKWKHTENIWDQSISCGPFHCLVEQYCSLCRCFTQIEIHATWVLTTLYSYISISTVNTSSIMLQLNYIADPPNP